MTAWNPYGTASTQGTGSGISDDNVNGAVVGTGLAKVMGLCDRLHIADCPPPSPKLKGEPQAEGVSAPVEDFSFLEEAKQSEIEFEEDAAPIVQLLAATVGGAPNVIDVSLERAQYQGVKAIDDNYVGLNLKGAQQLVYGRGEPEATGIVLLLHETDSLESARERLERIISERKLDLEVRDFIELSPVYEQATGLYQALFVFISGVIGLVVVFSVGNTVSMSVVERTQEIGTLRALGLNRRDVRRQFLTEGFILGITGATLGVILSFVTAYIVNGSNMSWTPPGNAQSVPIRLYMFGDWRLPLLIWFSLVCVAMVASVAPAIRASRLRITDALRYV
jgi:putative ABC transport system permease protein